MFDDPGHLDTRRAALFQHRSGGVARSDLDQLHRLWRKQRRRARIRGEAGTLNYVLRVYHNLQAAPSPNRLRVFLFSSIAEVGRMAGGGGVAGYYISEARAQLMVGTRGGTRRSNDIRSGRDEAQMDAESILLHEYAHHFMFQYFPATYPTWYQEGFAEFWGATRFLPNNVVEVGHPVNYRYGSFEGGRWLRAAQLLSAQNYGDVPEVDLLYAEGRLLVRHTFENRERQQQLQRYLALINAGTRYAEA
jgi:hypothetical protein